MSPVIIMPAVAPSPPGPTPTTITKRIASANDAATAVAWASWRSGSEVLYWHDPQGRSNNTNLRFTGLAIPRNATITEAVITVWGHGNRNGAKGTDYVTVGAEQVDDATAVTSYATHTSRMSNVGVTVQWAVPNYSHNQALASPDLKSIVQQIVNRAGWPNGTGGAIQFFIQNNSVPNLDWNAAPEAQSYSINSGASYIPLLSVTYS